MAHLLGRIILVPLGFLLAAVVGVFVLITLGSEKVTHAIEGSNGIAFSAGIELLSQALVLTSALTFIPSVLLIIVGEVARIRSIIYYVVGGGLSLVSIPVLAQVGQGAGLETPSTVIWQVFATAGFLAGFTYWLIAGRGA
ncbi:MAG: hypothetical protein ACR2PG_24950 [Hyphomicrobiaceae bacterium]